MFSPFDKKIDEITFDDLNMLIENEVAEGYYVEYKSDFQDNKGIAKSIASFANTHGGWYFIGIEGEKGTNVAKNIGGIKRKDKQPNVAKNIVGFDLRKYDQPKESIRQIVTERIRPIPYFITKLLKDDNGKNVLVVFIPESIDAPHIVDGVVYVREGELSIPIKDKHSLDMLYQKGVLFEEKVNAFLENPFGITKAEREQREPTINLCFIPKGFMHEGTSDFYESTFLDKLVELVDQEESVGNTNGEVTAIIPFSNIVRTSHSIIFRETTDGIRYYNLILELFYNGAARIQIPISYEPPKTPISPNNENEYLKCLDNQLGDTLSLCRLVDLAQTFINVEYSIKKYSKFLSMLKSNTDAFVTVWEMKNIFRLIPFVEAKSFLEHVKKYGVPISMYEYKKIQDGLNNVKWNQYENVDLVHLEIAQHFLMTLGLSKDSELFADSIESLLAM